MDCEVQRNWSKQKEGPYGIESLSALVQTQSLVRTSTTSLLIHTQKQKQREPQVFFLLSCGHFSVLTKRREVIKHLYKPILSLLMFCLDSLMYFTVKIRGVKKKYNFLLINGF